MNIINALHTTLALKVCKSSDEAIEMGYTYREPEHLPIQVKEVLIVKEGMESGKSSIDFILVDGNGQKYVFILTENLINMVANVAKASN